MRSRLATKVLVVFGALAFAGPAHADEEAIPVAKLPKAVRKAAKAKFPKARIIGAAKEVEDGETVYEVEMVLKGRSVDLAIEADGTVVEVEQEISAEELPKDVRKAIAEKHPDAKIAKAEAVTKGDDPVVYEITLASEVVLTPKGKFVEAEDDDDEKEMKAKDDDEDDDEKEMKAKKDDGKKSKAKEKDDDDEDEDGEDAD